MLWMKKKKIVVDAFIDNDIIAKYPITQSSANPPPWYKKLKSTIEINDQGHELQIPTFKRCDGMLDLLKYSFTLPMWADLSLVVEEDGRFHWKYPSQPYNFGLEQHPEFLMESAFNPLVHAKIMSPWLLGEKTGINFYQTQAVYSFNKCPEVLIPPGVVNYKYQNSTHINGFFARGKSYFFKAGQPMMYLIPMTEDKVEVKTHVLSTEEYNRKLKLSAGNKFIGSYKSLKSTGGCPITGRS